MADYGTQFIVDQPTPVFEIAGRRSPDSRIIYTGGTPGPRGPATSGRIVPVDSVPLVADLPASPTIGTVYHVAADDHLYVFNGTVWKDIGGINSTGVQSSDNSVTDILNMSQAAYDAIPVKSPTTFYIIT